MDGKVSMIFYRNQFPKMNDFLRLGPYTGSQIHSKTGGIKAMARDRHIVNTHH